MKYDIEGCSIVHILSAILATTTLEVRHVEKTSIYKNTRKNLFTERKEKC